MGFTGDRVILERNGKPIAALVPLEDLAAIIDAEDRSDLAAARRATGPTVSSEQAKKELGL